MNNLKYIEEFNLILNKYQINNLLNNTKIQPQDIFINLNFSINNETFSFNCCFYELIDQLLAYTETSENNFNVITYHYGFEIILFELIKSNDDNILQLNNKQIYLSKIQLNELIDELKYLFCKILKIWWTDYEISNFLHELF